MYSYKLKHSVAWDAKLSQLVVQRANDFEADMDLIYDGKEVDLKSILGIMSFSIEEGKEVEITAKGADAQQAIEAMKEIVKEVK